ncbi:hypothetical protein CRP143_gp42 [Roseobacter phage CRP-143]|nr:hypothetical protein CRP143_gp42 [Roseobacter phage CRP-143]
MAYIGNNLDSDIQVNKYEYTATAGQTTFACTYDRAVDVYLNGVKLDSSDFTATNGTAIVLASGANVGDIVDINAYFDVTYAGADAILPDQAGNSGKFLTTDGTNSSWGTVDLTDLNPTTFTIPNYSSAPSNPSAGDLYYNTTDLLVYTYDGNAWQIITNKMTASGGTETTYTVGSTTYKVHTFTSSGSLTVDGSSGSADILVVAGGGGGGYSEGATSAGDGGGGGGAGGMIATTAFSLSPGVYSVTVGAGGGGMGNGSNSVFGSLTAIGGGRGGSDAGVNNTEADNYGVSGGSGGGSASTCAGTATAGSGTTGQGFAGGYTTGCNDRHGAGGGGAGAVGGNGNDLGDGHGGTGANNSFRTGSPITYAGGGGGGAGGSAQNAGVGGAGGGANGGPLSTNGYSATANTGGGGGGCGAGNGSPGGSGGSGIVVIRYIV